MHQRFYIFLIFRWSSEPSRDLLAVFTREGALEEVPAVLFLPDSWSLPGCSDRIRHVFWYVKLKRNNQIAPLSLDKSRWLFSSLYRWWKGNKMDGPWGPEHFCAFCFLLYSSLVVTIKHFLPVVPTCLTVRTKPNDFLLWGNTLVNKWAPTFAPSLQLLTNLQLIWRLSSTESLTKRIN